MPSNPLISVYQSVNPPCGPFHLMEPIMQNIKVSQIISKQCFEFTKPPVPYQQQLLHCCSVPIAAHGDDDMLG